MMFTLGEYAVEVVSAYAVSLVLLAAIVGLSWRQAARSARALEQAEAKHG
jgi:heme exporter protein D